MTGDALVQVHLRKLEAAGLVSASVEVSDLKLGEISAQLDYLREQMASLQKILKDVE